MTAPQSPPPAWSPGQPLSAPGQMPHAFAAAWMARDANSLAALFTPDADFVNVTGIWWEDRQAIQTAHAYGLSRIFAQSTLTVGRTKIRTLAPDAAMVHARLILKGQTAPTGQPASQPDSQPAGQRQTIISFAMIRPTPQSWLCASAQNTDIIPGAETHLATATGLRPTDYRS